MGLLDWRPPAHLTDVIITTAAGLAINDQQRTAVTDVLSVFHAFVDAVIGTITDSRNSNRSAICRIYSAAPSWNILRTVLAHRMMFRK